MADETPYRRLPWAEADLLLHPGRFVGQREARREIDRLRSLLDEGEYPRDASLLARTATALESKASQITRWSRPISVGLSSVAAGLLSGAIAPLVRGPLDAASVASSVVCLALAIVSAMTSFLLPLVWSDVAEEYRRLGADLRRAGDKVGTLSTRETTGVRVDLGPDAAEASDPAAAPQARKAGTS